MDERTNGYLGRVAEETVSTLEAHWREAIAERDKLEAEVQDLTKARDRWMRVALDLWDDVYPSKTEPNT